MGKGSQTIDLNSLTRSGIRCLEELVQIAILAHEAEVSPEWLVVTCATCVESHFDRVLNGLINASEVEENRFANSLLANSHDDIFKTWDSRLKWLGNGFGVIISGDSPVQDFRALVELRNAVVHGQGHLTEIQQKNINKLLDLKRKLARLLDVQFFGPKVFLSSNNNLKVVQICRNVTLHLDDSVLKVHPNVSF